MALDTPGIHHVTATAADPGRNLDFYTETLGLRLVKRSVNQDDVSTYHLFYGDRHGSPGTSLTFFSHPEARRGQPGTGQVTTVGLTVPRNAIDFWAKRLEETEVDHDPPVERFGDTVLPFRDPDGLSLELVGTDAPDGKPPEGPVPPEYAIRGIHGVTVTVAADEELSSLLKAMGFRETEQGNERRRYESTGELGRALDVQITPDRPRGRQGAGTVHHVAFRVTEAAQSEWRDLLQDHGLDPTGIIDRKWFKSVYARTGPGVLFEFATDSPGYTVDEDLSDLGSELVLPPWLEDRREEIHANLPDLERGGQTDD